MVSHTEVCMFGNFWCYGWMTIIGCGLQYKLCRVL